MGLIGYDRFTSQPAYQTLAQLYPRLSCHLNYFHPVRKLLAKSRHGARVTKHYDQPRAPFQRLLDAGSLDPARQRQLERTFYQLNPIDLNKEIDQLLRTLWKLAERPAP